MTKYRFDSEYYEQWMESNIQKLRDDFPTITKQKLGWLVWFRGWLKETLMIVNILLETRAQEQEAAKPAGRKE